MTEHGWLHCLLAKELFGVLYFKMGLYYKALFRVENFRKKSQFRELPSKNIYLLVLLEYMECLHRLHTQ